MKIAHTRYRKFTQKLQPLQKNDKESIRKDITILINCRIFATQTTHLCTASKERT